MIISMIRRILSFSEKYAGRIRAAYPIAFLKSVFMNAPIMVAVALLPAVVGGTVTLRMTLIAALTLSGCLLAQSLLQYFTDRLQSGAGYEVFSDKRIEFGNHLRRLPMGYFSAGNIGRISTILSQDMVFIEEQSMMTIAGIVGDIFSQVILTVFLFTIDVRIGLAALATVLIAVAVGRVLTKVAFEKSSRRQVAIEDLTSAVLEYTEGFGVIRSYGMTGRGAKDIEASFRGIRDASLDFEASYVPYERALQILYAVGMTAILALSIYLAQLGTLPAVSFIGVFFFLFSFFAPLKQVADRKSVV